MFLAWISILGVQLSMKHVFQTCRNHFNEARISIFEARISILKGTDVRISTDFNFRSTGLNFESTDVRISTLFYALLQVNKSRALKQNC